MSTLKEDVKCEFVFSVPQVTSISLAESERGSLAGSLNSCFKLFFPSAWYIINLLSLPGKPCLFCLVQATSAIIIWYVCSLLLCLHSIFETCLLLSVLSSSFDHLLTTFNERLAVWPAKLRLLKQPQFFWVPPALGPHLGGEESLQILTTNYSKAVKIIIHRININQTPFKIKVSYSGIITIISLNNPIFLVPWKQIKVDGISGI